VPFRSGSGKTNKTYTRRQPLLWASLGFISDLANHVTIAEGQFPRPAGAQDAMIEVLVSQAWATSWSRKWSAPIWWNACWPA